MAERLLPREKWKARGSGSRYLRRRWGAIEDDGPQTEGLPWGKRRRARRDPVAVTELLRWCGVTSGRVLDAACGPARLAGAIGTDARDWVGVDFSAAMLEEASGHAEPLVRGDAEDLPFRSDAFDAVVACRLLHHFATDNELERALAELVRVTRRYVVASFWNSASWPGLRRSLGLSRGEGVNGRHARSIGAMRRVARSVGSRVVRVHHTVPILSQQTFVVLEKLPA